MQCRFSSQSLGIYSFPSSFSLFFLLIFTPFSKAKPDFEIAPKKTLATGGYPIDFCTWSWGGFTTGSRVGIMLYMLHVVFQGENTSNMNSNESCVCVLFLQVYCSLVQYYFLRDWCHWSKHSSRKLVFSKKKSKPMMDGMGFFKSYSSTDFRRLGWSA